jgi:hypothetical protein
MSIAFLLNPQGLLKYSKLPFLYSTTYWGAGLWAKYFDFCYLLYFEEIEIDFDMLFIDSIGEFWGHIGMALT